jgi:hypothetical protein
VLSHLTQMNTMFYILFHFKPIETFTHYHYCGLFTMMSHNWNIMFFLHDYNVKLSNLHENAKLFPLYQSIFEVYTLGYFFLPRTSWNNVVQGGLPHKPPLFFFLGYYQPQWSPMGIECWWKVFHYIPSNWRCP